MDKLSFFILNIFFNSLLTFFTSILLIEMLILLFRIKQGRWAAYLRIIPIAKLALDPFLYDFSRWAYTQGINPLNCQEGTRMLTAIYGPGPLSTAIEMTVPGNMTFTFADLIGHSLSSFCLNVFSTLFLFGTLLIIIKQIAHLYFSYSALIKLKQIKCKTEKQIENKTLAIYLKKIPLKGTLEQGTTAFVVGLFAPAIFISKCFSDSLTQKEYEAVIAHEIEHIRYKDNLIRCLLNMVSHIFWWVPTKWLMNRIEEGQELSCDSHCNKYEVDPLDLAAALSKSAAQTVLKPQMGFAAHFSRKSKIQKRVMALVTENEVSFKKMRLFLAACAVGAAFFGIFLGRYWIF